MNSHHSLKCIGNSLVITLKDHCDTTDIQHHRFIHKQVYIQHCLNEESLLSPPNVSCFGEVMPL